MKSLWTAPSRRRRGVTMVESAIAVPILLLVVFGIFDISRVLYSRFAVQHAVREGARFAVTGRRLSDPGGGFFTRRDSIIQTVVENAEPFVTLQPGQVSLVASITGPDSGGGPGELVTVRVIHHVGLITPLISVLFPNGEVVFTVASVFKNEPFPSSFAN